jgi:hypothetical protein
LSKSYKLEDHYHPGKTNIFADALSRKEHCNYQMVQPFTSCCDREEPSLRVISHGMLTNLSLIPSIEDDVIAAQRTDVGMGHIRRRLTLGEGKCFHDDVDGVLWLKNGLVVPKNFELSRKIVD